MLAVLFAFGNLAPFVLRRPAVYEVAILCGYCLTAAFLYFAYRSSFRGQFEIGSLVVTALILPLIFLCRPNLAACALVLVSASYLSAARPRQQRRGLPALLGIAFLPLAVGIAVQALYNLARFGSLAEYGMRYQLAGIEVAKFQLVSMSRALYTGLLYLFSVPSFSPLFPFAIAQADNLAWPFSIVGEKLRPFLPFSLFEPGIGMFVAAPAAIALGVSPAFALCRPSVRLQWFFWSVVSTAAVVGFATACFGGATLRYELDFVPTILLATGILLLWLDAGIAGNRRKVAFRTVLALAVAYSVFMSSALSMTGYSDYYALFYPTQYRAIAQFFQPIEERLTRFENYPSLVRVEAERPACANPVLGQPLLTTGVAGAGDFLSIRCDTASESFRVAWDHWGVPAKLGSRFFVPDHRTMKVEISAPALFPPSAARTLDSMGSNCVVRIDGQEVFHQYPCKLYPSSASQLYFFENPIGGTTVAAAYVGDVRGLPRGSTSAFSPRFTFAMLIVAAVILFATVLRLTRSRIHASIYTASVVIAFVAGAAIRGTLEKPDAGNATPSTLAPPAQPSFKQIDDRLWKDQLSHVSIASSAKVGARIDGSVFVSNASSGVWSASSDSVPVGGFQWIDSTGGTVSEGRFKLPPTLGPGEKRRVNFSALAPATPGTYQLRIDLLFEHVGWFQSRGNATLSVDVNVTS
jgi:hypothetical protein